MWFSSTYSWFLLLALAFAGTVRYDDYKVYTIHPVTRYQIKLLMDVETTYNLDFWTETLSTGRPIDIMVAPPFQREFEEFLNMNRMSFAIKVHDVQKMVEEEEKVKSVTC